MSKYVRIDKENLYQKLAEWDSILKRKILLVACGGTALTLKGYKASTKDIDFLVPRSDQFEYLNKMLRDKLGYRDTNAGFRDPSDVFRFDLFRGNWVFFTELLDPVDDPKQHEIVRTTKYLTIAVLNSYDLIISKMFRGDAVDVEDCLVLLKAESMDLKRLGQRYKETATFALNEKKCKTNLSYLVQGMEEASLDTTDLKGMIEKWHPM